MSKAIVGDFYGPERWNNNPRYLILHCSGTNPELSTYGAKHMDDYHVSENHWDAIGYHYVRRQDGVWEHGRFPTTNGAHCYGYNRKSVGLCQVGSDVGDLSSECMDDLLNLMRVIMAKHCLLAQNVYGHRELDTPSIRRARGVSPKSCPGVNTDMDWIRECLSK
jgi:N-acetylmuramoyl-L-alanine amidase